MIVNANTRRAKATGLLMGADESGKKELLAIDDGFRESEQSWHELLGQPA